MKRSLTFSTESVASQTQPPREGFNARKTSIVHINHTHVLRVTSDAAKMSEAEHVLLYLNSQTWTRGEASAALGDELVRAMDAGIHVLLVHEMPGVGGQKGRHGCEFGNFFSCAEGATPGELLKRGIYDQIALPLKGGAWREASLALLHDILAGDGNADVAAAAGSQSSRYFLRLRSSRSFLRSKIRFSMSSISRSTVTLQRSMSNLEAEEESDESETAERNMELTELRQERMRQDESEPCQSGPAPSPAAALRARNMQV